MLRTESTTDKSKKMRKLIPLLSGVLVVAVLAGALAFSIAFKDGAHAATPAYTQAQIISIIKSVFGNNNLGNQAVSVARCESSLNPNAVNPSSDAEGLFQIIPSTWRAYGSGNIFNPTDNSKAALKIYREQGHNSWSPWVCKPTTGGGCPPELAEGSSGSWVVTLQSKLDTLYSKKAFPDSPYHFTYPLAKDGQFGPQTQAAVKDFQKKKGLSVDGIVGPQTWHALGYC
ncbi:MAG TPA: peptidoglycan-binding protein [Ktedonobacteraceae bacterium]|nr:peptidoglycan-binding protein [Ktedonobacteraceae bacterium]